ncbi:MAG: hypothetical protein LBV12_10295 [Puniceicoccales bacterium]|nr:hypothetical protein [Puniceicoccales bacterium]
MNTPSAPAPVAKRRRLDFGGTGFSISLLLHLVLVLVAVFWVVSYYVESKNDEPETFATGAGGGSGGKEARIYEHKIKPKNARNMVKTPSKITVKGSSSSIALPDMPNMGISAFESGMLDGGSSKGFGGGSGGGIGTGQGLGVGGGKNMVGKFIMGMRVKAQKIAVYLDCSGSMTPYLPRVKEEIYEQFPDADIFEFVAIHIFAFDGDVYLGSNYKGKPHPQLVFYNQPNRTYTNVEKLSQSGTAFYNKHKDQLEKGSFGAWVDWMLREKYDAIVAFSDFQDGIRQFDKSWKTIHVDAKSRQDTDKRTSAQKAWERRWLNAFKKPGAPKLYLFSIEVEPQQLLQECVTASGGEVKMVTHLRQRKSARRAIETVKEPPRIEVTEVEETEKTEK